MVCGCDLPRVILAKIASAIGLKIICGSDDIVWLAPFLARESTKGKVIVSAKYVAVNLVLCSIAVGLAKIVHVSVATASERAEDIADKVIACIAAFLLLAYSVHLAHDEGYCGRREPCCVNRDAQGYKFHSLPQREEGYEEVKPYVVSGDLRAADSESDYEEDPDDPDLNCCESLVLGCLQSGLDRLPAEPGEDQARRRFIIVAALGNLDDFLVFFSIVLGTHFCWYQFIAGTTIGAVLIASALSTCLGLSTRLTECVKTVPLFLVLVLLATYIVLSAFLDQLSPHPPQFKGACK